MNVAQLKTKSLLTNLANGDSYYPIEPATEEQIEIFINRATANGVEHGVIEQLVDLYRVANAFDFEIVIGFHSCDDMIIFEWWDDQELWLGQRDFNTLRWANHKFCLGDASSISFSAEHEFDTLIELVEGCIKEINDVR